jgi:hypothetical protein
MEIWDIVELRYSDDDEEGEIKHDYKPPTPHEPVTLEILINAMTNTNLYKKYNPVLPTPQQALKDLNRILNAQKVRSWFLRRRS